MLGLSYLWFTLFPGKIDPFAVRVFGLEQVQKGRAYSLVPRLMYILSFLSQIIFLAWLILSGRVRTLVRGMARFSGGRDWIQVTLIFLFIWSALKLLSFPFHYYSDYVWQHQWGFTSQSPYSWWSDEVKSSFLDLSLTAIGVLLLFAIFRRWPHQWWLVGSLFFSGWLILQSFLWPIFVAPIFNRFTPVQDSQVIRMVGDLAQSAGLRIDKILVMDASRQTTKANAYFTGVGDTQRIVLYDTLLERYDSGEVEAVIAHEMAHWKLKHILKGLVLGIFGSFILWKLAYLILNSFFAERKYSAEAWPIFLSVIMMVSFISSPLQNYISRQMETQADQYSVQLTHDVPAAVRLQMDLAARNLSDVSPPPFIEWFSYTHPPAPDRIEAIEEQKQTGIQK